MTNRTLCGNFKALSYNAYFQGWEKLAHKTVMPGGGMTYVLYAGRGGSGVGRIWARDSDLSPLNQRGLIFIITLR